MPVCCMCTCGCVVSMRPGYGCTMDGGHWRGGGLTHTHTYTHILPRAHGKDTFSHAHFRTQLACFAACCSTPTVATLQETIQQGRRERTTLQTEHLLQQAKLVKLDQQCSRLLVWGGKVASGALMTTGAPGVVPLTSLSAPGTMDWRLAQLQREVLEPEPCAASTHTCRVGGVLSHCRVSLLWCSHDCALGASVYSVTLFYDSIGLSQASHPDLPPTHFTHQPLALLQKLECRRRVPCKPCLTTWLARELRPRPSAPGPSSVRTALPR